MCIIMIKCALTTYSLVTSRCWFYGGRNTGEPREKPSKHGRDQQLYTHKFQVRQSTHWLYPGGHPSSYNPVRLCLTSELSGGRQRANHIRHPYENLVTRTVCKTHSFLLTRMSSFSEIATEIVEDVVAHLHEKDTEEYDPECREAAVGKTF